MADVKINNEWKQLLAAEFHQPYFEELIAFVKEEYNTQTIYPPGRLIFHAFDLCPPSALKVVILGQDPYHGPGQAHGLCFSVNDGVPFPPSLQNIFKEIQSDLGTPPPPHGNLTRWAEQGVLLLNATLTVRAGHAASHQGRGWEHFTDRVIQTISDNNENIIFLLWGSYAIRKSELIDPERHCVLTAPHPSPLSAHRGFLGCRHFSKSNTYLKQIGKNPITW